MSPSGPRRRASASPAHMASPGFRLGALAAAVCWGAALAPVSAQERWDPFGQLETNKSERRSRPANRPGQPVVAPNPPAVERAPLVAPNGQQDADPKPPEVRSQNDPQAYYPRSSNGRPRPAPNASYDTEQPYPDSPSRPAATPPAAPRASNYEAREDLAPPPTTRGATTQRLQHPQPASTPTGAAPVGVDRADLTPVMAADGSALPFELWRGLDIATVERMIASLTIPPRSAALHDLWRRLIVADVQAPQGGESNAHFEAMRLEALYRSGLMTEITEHLAHSKHTEPTPLTAMLQARSEIGSGRREAGCDAAKRVGDIRGDIPKSLRGEAILVSGYCAAVAGNAPAAGLLADLAREEGMPRSPGLAALEAVAYKSKADVSLAKGQQLALVDYRILELANAAPAPDELVKVATPALLVMVASDAGAKPELRLEAAEAAARINALKPEALGSIYRAVASRLAPADAAIDAQAGGNKESPRRRALLFASAETERTPFKKVRDIRAFVDSARRSGLYLPALVLVAKLTDQIGLVPEIGWFAETAIEANLAAADYSRARTWANFARSLDTGRAGQTDHWQALIDISDPDFPTGRGQSLGSVESMALSGRFTSDLLHRLATVLDALEYNVPIPLWEAASRTPQPSTGHLPATGVLSQLQDASKKREFGRTVLLAMHALGPDGAEGAHMISLGDSIRALKRAGLDKDARRLGLEALLGAWPRTLAN